MADALAARGLGSQHCVGIIEHDDADALATLLAALDRGATAYIVPRAANNLRRRFLCGSAGVSVLLGTGDLALSELTPPASTAPREVVGCRLRGKLRTHLQHRSGKLLLIEIDGAALVHALLDDGVAIIAQLCGLKLAPLPQLASLLGDSPRRTELRRGAVVTVVLNGTQLAPVGTPGELCIAGVRLLSDHGEFSTSHPLLDAADCVRTGYRAVQLKDGTCRILDT
ncbi:MAG: hypothetical protein JNM09_31685 [Blastocatellia bacterium]|nr:hypothetical protein [Blastocatellia bacterium]